MNPSQSTTEETVYGSEATYKQLPDEASTAAGVVPLDTLPAAWWNALWNQQTKQDNNAYADINDLRQEVLSVLSSAPSPITPSATVHNQLYNAIEQIRQTIATASTPGAIKASSDVKSISVGDDGTPLVNAFADWEGTDTVAEVLTTKADNTDLADAFDASVSYTVGQYAIYNGTLYRCVTAHTGAWSADDFAATTVATEIQRAQANAVKPTGVSLDLDGTELAVTIQLSDGTSLTGYQDLSDLQPGSVQLATYAKYLVNSNSPSGTNYVTADTARNLKAYTLELS